MLDALKTLFENDVVSEDVRASIEDAWNKKIQENKQQVTAELREEFAQKYEHDKRNMIDAIDSMISERLASEIEEFADDRKQLAEAKAKYAVAMRENATLLQKFVTQQLGKEVSELHEDQKSMAAKFAKLEEFVVEALSKEIAEFNIDKKDLAETKVRLIKEAKTKFAEVQKSFIQRSAQMVSETVAKGLKSEITALKEDIEAARQNDFGRRLFEAYANEYANSYMNENSEVAKLMKVVALKDKQLAEAKAAVVESTRLVESKEAEKKRIVEAALRKDTINELTAPLSKDQKEIMIDLLESVQTAKLRSAFDKYLPSVIDSKSPAKQKATLTEGKEVTGNRDEVIANTKAKDDNVFELRRLAGLN